MSHRGRGRGKARRSESPEEDESAVVILPSPPPPAVTPRPASQSGGVASLLRKNDYAVKNLGAAAPKLKFKPTMVTRKPKQEESVFHFCLWCSFI
jgi:hypothetical protein